MYSTFLVLLVILLLTIYLYFKWFYQYWKRKNVFSPEAKFPFGNFYESLVGRKGNFQIVSDFYQEYKSKGYKFIGLNLISNPIFLPIDLELLKLIMIKDHQYFMDRGVYYNEKDEPLTAHLFAIEGKKWQTLRAKLSPTFTSGKMKMMFSTILDVAKILEKSLAKMAENKTPLEIKEILSRYSTDIIGSCAFGLDCNSFDNPDSEFRNYGKLIFLKSFTRSLKRSFAISYPNLARKIRLKVQNPIMVEFFMNIVRNTIKYRKENSVDRNDFMKLLIELQEGPNGLTFEEIAAQAFVFFGAGFETSATTMTFTLFELAKDQSLQDKLREEIHTVIKKHDGQLTYEGVKEMDLLNSVIFETLRMYPPLPMLNRVCTRRYKIPNTDVIIEKGQSVFIPIFGIHYDEELYPNPNKFDPSRFSAENKGKLNQFAHLPFGEGPRNCIGLRFGVMQTKVGLISIIKNLKITLNEKTITPLEFDPLAFVLNTKHNVYLNAEKV